MANRLLTINLRKYLVNQPRPQRHRKAARYLRERIAHYTKVEENNVKISKELSVILTKHHVKSMHPIRVNISIEKGIASVTPFVGDVKPTAPKVTEASTQKQQKTVDATVKIGSEKQSGTEPTVQKPKAQKEQKAGAVKA